MSELLDSLGCTHWAEIEPPPKPDPCEEAWRRYQIGDFSKYETPEMHFKSGFNAGWDAAIKWKEGQ